MFSNRTIQELEEAVANENACALEVQSSSGRIFTVHIQNGRAQQLSARQQEQQQQYQQQPGSDYQQQPQRQPGQGTEWRVRKLQTQQGQNW